MLTAGRLGGVGIEKRPPKLANCCIRKNSFSWKDTSAPVPPTTFYLPRDMRRRMVISCVLPIGVAAMNFLSRLKVAATKSEMSNWRILGWAVVASGIVGVVFFGIKLMSSLP